LKEVGLRGETEDMRTKNQEPGNEKGVMEIGQRKMEVEQWRMEIG